MKNLTKMIIAVFIYSIFSSGCKKDNIEKANTMILEYELDQGLLIERGYNEAYECYNYRLYLYTPGLNIDVNEVFYGIGSFVDLSLYSSKSGELDEGNYEFGYAFKASFNPFFSGVYVIGYNSNDEDLTRQYITHGTLNISTDSGEYEISFNDNDAISFYYKGSLTYIDASDVEKK